MLVGDLGMLMGVPMDLVRAGVIFGSRVVCAAELVGVWDQVSVGPQCRWLGLASAPPR